MNKEKKSKYNKVYRNENKEYYKEYRRIYMQIKRYNLSLYNIIVWKTLWRNIIESYIFNKNDYKYIESIN